MTNSVQKKVGYRDIVYNIRTEKFYTPIEGDNYEELEIALGSGEGGGGEGEEVEEVDAYTKAESDARYLAVNISTLPELPTV